MRARVLIRKLNYLRKLVGEREEKLSSSLLLPVDTVSDTTSDPNYKRAQEDKLGDRANEEPHIAPIDHDKEVPREPTGYSIQELIQQVFNMPWSHHLLLTVHIY